MIGKQEQLFIYPAKHFVMPEERIAAAVDAIKQELDERLEQFKIARQAAGSPAAERPHAVRYRNDAWRWAIARGSRTTAGRFAAGRRARRRDTLFDFFPDDFLLFVDESHATVPQVRGDVSPATAAARRRWSSTAFGCPARSTIGRCKFDEWEKKINQAIYVSATPATV